MVVTTSGIRSSDRDEDVVFDVEGFCVFIFNDIVVELTVVVLVVVFQLVNNSCSPIGKCICSH